MKKLNYLIAPALLLIANCQFAKGRIRLLLFFLFCGGFPTSSTAQYTKLFDFTGSNGSTALSTFFSDGTFLYGTTYTGGTNNNGTIFKIKPDGTSYTKLLDFDNTNGNQARGSFISDGTFLYGMTIYGGIGAGIIFKIKPDGTGYDSLHVFVGPPDGRGPVGTPVSDGTFLYGMTEDGGTNDIGTIFKIKPDGTSYTKLFDFAGAANGSIPRGSLIFDGTFLYGMTFWGGANDLGTIFKIKPDGTGYSKLLDFAGTATGRSPYGSLFSDGTFLYGMTQAGGTNGMGVIFKIMPDGTGFSKLLDFAGITNGRFPWGTLISDGIFLYGMTPNGGTNDFGTVFRIMPDGTGYSKLLDFAGTPDGKSPYGTLISDGTFLYGMTGYGGTSNIGTIFKYAFTIGIKENEAENIISVSPNPFCNEIKISRKFGVGSRGNGEIILFDITGKEILRQKISKGETTISTGKIAEGFYLLNYSDGNRIEKMKVVKM